MFYSLTSACLVGSQVLPVRIEIDIQPGLPYFVIIGLADKRIDEARERVRSAIKNSGYGFPLGKVTVNLCPSDIPKQGTGLDLGIALGILIASGFAPRLPDNVWVLGELSLDGGIQRIRSLLPVMFEASTQGVRACIIPAENYGDASQLPESKVCCVRSLQECLRLLAGSLTFETVSALEETVQELPDLYAIDQVKGQNEAKRLLSIAVAGGHSLVLTGPPGTGKTLLAQAAHQLMPRLLGNALMEVGKVYAYASQSYAFDKRLPPLRMPHHTVSLAAFYGGGTPVRPGELSLAHNGVLVLDELPRYSRKVREVMLKPMEDCQVQIQRHGVEYVYPADSLIIATQNACICGRRGVDGGGCICTAGEMQKYAQALPEPLLDRFQLFYTIDSVCFSDIAENSGPAEYEGRHLAQKISRARHVQHKRNGAILNGRGYSPKLAYISAESKAFLEKVTGQFQLSVRSMYNVLKVARTIADMAGESEVGLPHIQEAVQYRRRPHTQV